MQFIETRGNDGQRPSKVSFSTAILGPMSSFGGIYAPEALPQLGIEFLRDHFHADYKTLARDILGAFDLDVDQAVIDAALDLYDGFDDPVNPVPVVKVYEDLYVSELYHGPTRAFKDMALQPFGAVLSALALERNEKYLIMVATSGDTGPAALETFKDRPNIKVACLYPAGGTSDVQRLQMVTEDAPNLKVIGIEGDFDDAQNALKLLLSSAAFNATLKQRGTYLSAANSVNFGRIIFQLIYHLHSYLELVRQGAVSLGDKVYLDVPSGNFGNALGGYYAMQMGLPVEKILIASNRNNVLTQLINDGIYDIRRRDVIPTTSPAMDILKSSNIERVLFDLYGPERTRELMEQLDQEHWYRLEGGELQRLQEIFSADWCDDEEGEQTIRDTFRDGYLMDPHTATCFKTYRTCATRPIKTIAYSTAEWTKFAPTIAAALGGKADGGDLEALRSVAAIAHTPIPKRIGELFERPIAHPRVVPKTDIETEVLAFL